MLEGPTAIAFIEADGDLVGVAKALSDTAKTTRILSIRGGILDGNPIGEGDVQNLATLPPVEVLRGQVLGAITAPLMTVVALMSAPVRDLLGLIDARIAQLQDQGDVPAESAGADSASSGDGAEDSAPSPAATEEATEAAESEDVALTASSEAGETTNGTQETASAQPEAERKSEED
jgi:hypothetical protein